MQVLSLPWKKCLSPTGKCGKAKNCFRNFLNALLYNTGRQRPYTCCRQSFFPLTCQNLLQRIIKTQTPYTFLFIIFSSHLPVARSINLTKSDTLLSSFSEFQISFANSSIPPSILSFTGSPSKLGRGFPSPI